MAALPGNQNSVGNSGGKTLNDRRKAAKARNLILDQVIRVFEADPLTMSESETSLKRELLLKMAPNCLPRITEVTGEDGEPLRLVFDSSFNRNTNQGEAPQNSAADSEQPSQV